MQLTQAAVEALSVIAYKQPISKNDIEYIRGVNCDSVVKTNLEISPYWSSVDTLKLCIGDSAYLSSNYQTSSGVYYDTIQSINGCDSVVETLLIIDSVRAKACSAVDVMLFIISLSSVRANKEIPLLVM
mgnify:CR=1 FL=1